MRPRWAVALLAFTLLLSLSSPVHTSSDIQQEPKPDTKTKAKAKAKKEKRQAPITKVVRLNEGNISVVYEGEDWFIMFEALWCSHCKRLWPTWVKLAEVLEGKVNVAVVDAQSHIPVARSFGVLSYPTLHLIHDNRFFKYSGSRDLEALVDFATNFEDLPEGTKLPLVGLTFYQTLQHMESRTAATAFGIGALIGLFFLALFLYCADGANDEEISKIMQGIAEHKKQAKDSGNNKGDAQTKAGSSDKPAEKEAPAESKKDR